MKKTLSMILSVTLAICGVLIFPNKIPVQASTIDFDSTAMEVASDMGAGWNLGNALDAYDSTGGNELA